MTKKASASKAEVAPLPEEPLRDSVTPLSLDERVALRAIFKNPVFVRAWKNAQCLRPSCLIAAESADMTLNGPHGREIANNRLHEMRGWEMATAALLKQCNDPVLRAPVSTETYSDRAAVVGPVVKKQ